MWERFFIAFYGSFKEGYNSDTGGGNGRIVSEETRKKIDEKIAKKTDAYIYNSLTDDERKIYKALSDGPVYIDDVLKASGLNHERAAKVLLDLELKKLIEQLPGKQFIRPSRP